MPARPSMTGSMVADQLGIPLKTTSAALAVLSDAKILVKHGTVPSKGRPSRLYASSELLGRTGASRIPG